MSVVFGLFSILCVVYIVMLSGSCSGWVCDCLSCVFSCGVVCFVFVLGFVACCVYVDWLVVGRCVCLVGLCCSCNGLLLMVVVCFEFSCLVCVFAWVLCCVGVLLFVLRWLWGKSIASLGSICGEGGVALFVG